MTTGLATAEQGDSEVRQLELYKDDSVVVCYSDGSKLLMSPCGASFLHVDHKPRGVARANKTHQTTRHTVSQYRNKLRCALEFRNKFAERPFLCEWYCKTEKEIRKYPVSHVTWPLCPHCITHTTTASLLLHSLDRNASIELLAGGRSFTVTYLVVCEWTRGTAEVLHYNVTIWGSVCEVPQDWKHPLDLLVATQQEITSRCLCHVDKEERCLLPTALPLLCRNVHLHMWEKSPRQPGAPHMLKVVHSDCVTYRLMWDECCVEAYPNQHTVVKSCDPEGRFFDMWYINQHGQVSQYKMCYDQLPHYKEFCVVSVIGKMSRLLKGITSWHDKGVATQSICWLVNNENCTAVNSSCNMIVKEEATVDGVGKLVAYCSGKVYIAFTDNTTLEMYRPQQDRVLTGVRLPSGHCKILSNSGHYHLVCVAHPQPYQWHVGVAVKWCEWAYSTHHTSTFTISSNTDHDRLAIEEVKKIQQLCMELDSVENAVPSGDSTEYSHAPVGAPPINQVLQETHQALCDIDNILQS